MKMAWFICLKPMIVGASMWILVYLIGDMTLDVKRQYDYDIGDNALWSKAGRFVIFGTACGLMLLFLVWAIGAAFGIG